MNPINFERLEKLATFLDVLPPKKFWFGTLISDMDSKGCGTVCCAIGWTPKVFPELVRWGSFGVETMNGALNFSSVSEFLFGLDTLQTDCLFDPHCPRECPLPRTATAKQVAAHIRKFIAENQ